VPWITTPDIPPPIQERIVCSISAAVKYQVPANIILAVAEKEAGKPGQWIRNSNGSYDVGQMQFNTNYLADLAHYGITANDVAATGCYSFDLAAWRLRKHILHDTGDLWTRSANYHSRTRRYNAIYREDLMKKALKWADWLEARFVTYDVTKPGVAPSMVSAQPAPERTAASPTLQSVKTISWNTYGYTPQKVIINGQP